MEQGVIRTQHPEQNVARVFEVDCALPPPAVDILSAAVDDIMVIGVICKTRNRIILSHRFLSMMCVKI